MTGLNVWVESNERGESIAFALEWPGVCGWGISLNTALHRLRDDFIWTLDWLERHGCATPSSLRGDFDLTIVETVPATGNPLACDSEGAFNWDLVPFTADELGHQVRWLNDAHRDLCALWRLYPPDLTDIPMSTGKRTPREIVDHVAIAQWWYMTRIVLPNFTLPHWSTLGDDAFERLTAIHAIVIDKLIPALRTLSEDTGSTWTTRDGELWNARKVIRRSVWHALFHYKELSRSHMLQS